MIAVQGNIAGALVPLGAAAVLDAAGTTGLFTLIAVMYVISAIVIRFAPETFGRALEDINIED